MPMAARHRYSSVDAGGLGGGGEAARYRLAVEAAEHRLGRLRAQP